MALSFAQIKSTILFNARPYGTCPGYYDILRATTLQELIDAGIPFLTYAALQEIITPDVLANVDEATLNANGIYTTGSATINNPLLEIFIFNNASLTINIDTGRNNVNTFQNASAHITVTGDSFCKLGAYHNSVANMTLNTTAAGCVDADQQSIVNVITNGNSVGDLKTSGEGILTVTANDTSYALVQGFGQSAITPTGAGEINLRLYEQSVNTVTPILI